MTCDERLQIDREKFGPTFGSIKCQLNILINKVIVLQQLVAESEGFEPSIGL